MPGIDPKQLLAAAMAQGGGGGNAAPDVTPNPGAASVAGGSPTGPQGGMQDSLPSEMAGAMPAGADTGGVLAPSNAGLASQLGVGADNSQSAQPDQMSQMMQALQDPSTPAPVKQQIQAQLQLAALRALTGGPSGAAGTPAQGSAS